MARDASGADEELIDCLRDVNREVADLKISCRSLRIDKGFLEAQLTKAQTENRMLKARLVRMQAAGWVEPKDDAERTRT